VNNEPITTAHIRHAKEFVKPPIAYSAGYEGWEAAHFCKLDLERWDNGGYPPRFMAKTIAFYRLHNLVALHTRDSAIKGK